MSFDTPEQNRRFAEKFEFPFQLLSDSDHSICVTYGAADSREDVAPRRIAYLIDENGTIVEAHARVDASAYPREQLERLSR
jgi:thioredoxin-dependent peroxiredoxin